MLQVTLFDQDIDLLYLEGFRDLKKSASIHLFFS